MASGMAPRNPPSFFARLLFRRVALAPALFALGLAACGFGDDRPLPGGDPDAPPADGPPDGPPIDTNPPPAMAKILEVRPNPPTPIPDDDEVTGASISFTVTGITVNTGLDVQVDVTHPYSGDLRIELLRDAAVVKVLKEADLNDNSDNVVTTYSLTPADLGTPLNGTYSVKLLDTGVGDLGVINLVKLTFKVN
jgi:Proprotein convertase P-domain